MKESETMKNSVKTALDTKKDLLSLIDYVKCYHPEIFRMIPLSMSVDDLKKNTEIISDHYIECLNMIGSVDIIDEGDIYDGQAIDIMPYVLGEKDFAEYDKLLSENFERLKEIDERSRQKGSILGRYVDFVVADGKAFYQIRQISGDEVYLVHCPGIHPDDYMDPVIGQSGWMSLKRVTALIEGRDHIKNLFDTTKCNTFKGLRRIF